MATTKQLQARLITRNDTAANWKATNPVPMKGEICAEIDTGLLKIGDGVNKYNDLSYLNKSVNAAHYEGTAEGSETDNAVITRVLTGASATAKVDDIFIVKRLISTGHYSYTAYVYNGTGWAAMDGNYSADNVYFSSDLVATEKVGTITIPSSGSATVSAAGKTVTEVLKSILAKEKNPTITQPAVSLSVPQNKAYEVGTKITPSYTASLSAGSYEYGPATGVTASAWSVVLNTSTPQTLTTASGKFNEVTVEDSTNLSITATATHGAGAAPKTNIGTAKAELAIQAGTKSATSSAKVTGYRSFFYGVDTGNGEITSATIRALTNGGAYNSAKTLNVAPGATAGAKRVIVAYPANTSRAGIKEVLLTSTMNLDITSSYVAKPNVTVEGANSYTGIEYKVYVYQPASIGGDETHKITLA